MPEELVNTPDEARDQKWEDKFLHAFAQTKVEVLSAEPHTGPDNWPYLMVSTEDSYDPELKSPTLEPVQQILAWLAERGIGMVINAQKEYPDFILTYGMIWYFRATGRFILRGVTPKSQTPNSAQKVEITSASLKQFGPPTEEYLPINVRRVLKDFFRDQGILNPRWLMLSEDGKNFDLGVSMESLGSPPQSEWQGIGEALSWFLPGHYSILIISEKGLPEFVGI